jgi:hypothetical protein
MSYTAVQPAHKSRYGTSQLSTVQLAHACNLSYSESRDWEYSSSKPAWGKSWQDFIISTSKLGMVEHTCDSCYVVGLGG